MDISKEAVAHSAATCLLLDGRFVREADYRAQAARIAELTGERDRQYEQNAEFIVRIAELEAALDDKDGMGMWRFWSGKAAEIAEKTTAQAAKIKALVDALEMVARQIHSGDDRPDDTFADFNGEQTEQIFAALAAAKETT